MIFNIETYWKKRTLYFFYLTIILFFFSCAKSEFKISGSKRGVWTSIISIDRKDRNNVILASSKDTLILDFIDENTGKILRTDSVAYINNFTWTVGEEPSDRIYTHVKYLDPPTHHDLFYIVKSTRTYEEWEFTDYLWFNNGERDEYNIELFKQ